MGIFKTILIILITALIVVIVYANTIVGSAIERAGSQALGTDVNVKFVSINPIAGSASISEISIANPQGYSEKNALELKGFSAEIDIVSLFSDVVKIKELRIDEPIVMLEQNVTGNNLMALYRHISASASGGSYSQSSGNSKKLMIDNLYINGGTVRLVSAQFKNAVSPLSAGIGDIYIKDIGKGSNGATVGQVAKIVIKEISDKARQIDITKFGTGALRQVGSQLGIDADQLIKGRESQVEQLRGLLGSP